MACCNDNCCNLAYTTTAKGVVVWDSNGCAKKLVKPTYSSAFIYDGAGTAKWADGSSEKPFCLPNIQEGTGYLTTFLIGTTPQGCFFKIPVIPIELELCPQNPGDPALIVTVLTVSNAP